MKINSKKFAISVYKLVKEIPSGKVMTYGQIAAILGVSRYAQYVGWSLHWADQKEVPYQRVLNRFGGLANGYPNGGRDRHRADLVDEGIDVSPDGTVDLKKYLWWPKKITQDLVVEFEEKLERNKIKLDK